MEITSLCLMLSATLNIHPDRTQFHWYNSFNLSCTAPTNSGAWILKTNVSSTTCVRHLVQRSSCTIDDSYPSDSGMYWCESKHGACSNTISIIVTDGVILESPALPVAEGAKVMLRCHYKGQEDTKATSNFTASFYKDGVFIGRHDAGKKTFLSVSKSDEGFYQCEHPTKGLSQRSWLAVCRKAIAEPSPSPPSSPLPPPPPVMSLPKLLCSILLVVLYTAMLIVCVKVYRKWAKAQAEAKRASGQLLPE